MSKYLFAGLAAILTAAGAAATQHAATGTDEPAAPGGGEATEPKRGRGRPAGSTNATQPADTGAGATTGPTDAERLETNRALIKPLIDGGQGEEVKKITAKYSKNGLKDIPAASQAEFEKDIQALLY